MATSVTLADGSTVQKTIGKAGVGANPTKKTEVGIHYYLKTADGKPLISSATSDIPFKFRFGEPTLLPPIETLLETMALGEFATFKLTSKQIWGNKEQKITSGDIVVTVSPEDALILEIELLYVRPYTANKWDMEADERLAVAKEMKEAGNKLFIGEQNVEAAKDSYKAGYDTIAMDTGPIFDEIKLSLLLNLSLVTTKLKQFSSAQNYSSKAVEMAPSNPKAYFRRAQAYEGSGQLDEALKDINKSLAISPENYDLQNEKDKIESRIKRQREKERKLYQSMLSSK